MKTVFITGCSRGMGLEWARQFAKDGNYQVIATSRKLNDDLNQLSKQNNNVHYIVLDTSDHSSIKQAYEATKKITQKVDILMNNAAILPYPQDRTVTGVTSEDMLNAFKVNSLGPLLIIQTFLPILNMQDGLVVNVTSRVGSIADNGSGGIYAYRTSKAAMNMINTNLSLEYKDKGIKFVLLHPGYIKTGMTGGQGHRTPAEAVTIMKKLVLSWTKKDCGKYYSWDGSILPW